MVKNVQDILINIIIRINSSKIVKTAESVKQPMISVMKLFYFRV